MVNLFLGSFGLTALAWNVPDAIHSSKAALNRLFSSPFCSQALIRLAAPPRIQLLVERLPCLPQLLAAHRKLLSLFFLEFDPNSLLRSVIERLEKLYEQRDVSVA